MGTCILAGPHIEVLRTAPPAPPPSPPQFNIPKLAGHTLLQNGEGGQAMQQAGSARGSHALHGPRKRVYKSRDTEELVQRGKKYGDALR